MNKHFSSRSSLFLIELILSIFFFIIAAAICIQLFVNTFFLSRETIETNQALLWSQNIAELFLGNQGNPFIIENTYSNHNCITELLPNEKDSILICFDKDWHLITTFSESTYIILSTYHIDESFSYEDIYIAKTPIETTNLSSINDFSHVLCQDKYAIYQLSVKKFIPQHMKGASDSHAK